MLEPKQFTISEVREISLKTRAKLRESLHAHLHSKGSSDTCPQCREFAGTFDAVFLAEVKAMLERKKKAG